MKKIAIENVDYSERTHILEGWFESFAIGYSASIAGSALRKSLIARGYTVVNGVDKMVSGSLNVGADVDCCIRFFFGLIKSSKNGNILLKRTRSRLRLVLNVNIWSSYTSGFLFESVIR